MRRRGWAAAVAVAVIVAGAVGYGTTRSHPVPGVTGTLTAEAADASSPDAARFAADVHRVRESTTTGEVVEVRVAWQLAETPDEGCSVWVLVLPDTFDVKQALQEAVREQSQQVSATARRLEFDTRQLGWVTGSGANVSMGMDGRVIPVLRDAGLPSEQAFTMAASARSGTFTYVYETSAALPVDPERFRGWALMQCGDRVGSPTALTVAGA